MPLKLYRSPPLRIPGLALNLGNGWALALGGTSMHGVIAIVGLVVAVAALGLQWAAFRRNRQ